MRWILILTLAMVPEIAMGQLAVGNGGGLMIRARSIDLPKPAKVEQTTTREKPEDQIELFDLSIDVPKFEQTKPETPDRADQQPTPMREVHRILALLSPKPSETFVDFGCGPDARVCVAASSVYGCKSIGVEIDPDAVRSARRRVRELGLDDLIEIKLGDVLTTDVEADVGFAYLWKDLISDLRPKLTRLKRFATYQHSVPWVTMTKRGDAYVWKQGDGLQTPPGQMAKATPAERSSGIRWVTDHSGFDEQGRPFVMYNGQREYARDCNRSTCGMCNYIQRELNALRSQQPTSVSNVSKPARPKGHWETRRICYKRNGKRYCRQETVWVSDE